jgi:hypothetical protein
MRECLGCDKPCEPGYDLCPECVRLELDYDAEQGTLQDPEDFIDD